MAQKKKVTATVISQKQIGEQIFDLWLETKLAKDAHPGQFVAVYPHGESMLLPRPISICETDKAKNRLRLVYRVAGKARRSFRPAKQATGWIYSACSETGSLLRRRRGNASF